MSKFYYSTKSDCDTLLSDMDNYFEYPKNETLTTAEVLLVSGSEYLVCVPDAYYNNLTQDQKDKCKDSMPASLTNPID
tara:strand:- start:743 stop:976 length:234 start_codon:yes stop_codon:yes gene_type:complete